MHFGTVAISSVLLLSIGIAANRLEARERIKTPMPQPVFYRTVKVEGVSIFYREAGPPDAPVILLLHGLPSSSRMYQPLLESSLSGSFRLIAPDYPGFGHSSWPDHKAFQYTFDHLAAVMEAFTEQLHLGRYVLFMQDYGGPVGF